MFSFFCYYQISNDFGNAIGTCALELWQKTGSLLTPNVNKVELSTTSVVSGAQAGGSSSRRASIIEKEVVTNSNSAPDGEAS